MDEGLKAFLKDPKAYGLPKGAEVKHLQTHISDVFIAGDHVFKFKKPVDFGFLDFTTLEKRRFYLNQEIELNRRLAPGIYEGLAAIIQEKDGSFRLSENQADFSKALEFAVRMKRLDDAWSLKAMLEAGKIEEAHIRKLSQTLHTFYQSGRLDRERASFGKPERIKRNTNENFEQTLPFVGWTISAREFATIEGFTNRFLIEHRDLFEKRLKEGFVRDGHGDLHTDHIYFPPSGEVLIIDRIEFNDRFRFHDIASDVAFLTMDLAFQGFPSWATVFKDAFLKETNDKDLLTLLPFYEAYRAYVRGKVEGFALDKGSSPQHSPAFQRVRKYFRLALRRALGLLEPLLLVVLGPMGSGKTTLAKALAETLDIPTLSSDLVRKELAGIGEKRHYVGFGEGIYSLEFTQKTYAELTHRALGHLKEGRSVLIEGGFPTLKERALPLTELSHSGIHARAVFISCEASKATLTRRLENRQALGEQLTDGRVGILDSQLASYAPIPLGIDAPLLRVWTEKPIESQIEQVLASEAIRVG